MTETLTIALAKGRLQNEALKLFGKAGIEVDETALQSRRLLIPDKAQQYNFIFVKPADAPTYVEYGIADAGICGLDVLLEARADVHQPLNLGIGYCQMVVAGKRDQLGREYNRLRTLRIATKYPRFTAEYFQQKGVPIDLIYLSGSVELASALGLSDYIVDLVETGRTLQENGLAVLEVMREITARLIVNRAAYQLKRSAISSLLTRLESVL